MQASSDNAQGIIQNTVDKTDVCAATPNWCTVLSVEQTKVREAVRSALAPAPHSDPASRLRSVTWVAGFLGNVSRWWRNVSDLSGFTPR